MLAKIIQFFAWFKNLVAMLFVKRQTAIEHSKLISAEEHGIACPRCLRKGEGSLATKEVYSGIYQSKFENKILTSDASCKEEAIKYVANNFCDCHPNRHYG